MEYSKSRYGLLLPVSKEKNSTTLVKRAAAFDDDSDEEEEKQQDWIKTSLKKISSGAGMKKQTRLNLARTLQEDPTAFEYDEVYDKMQAKKEKENLMKKLPAEKKPKYIESLLKEAEKRKMEFERRKEREVQKEREAEGDKFKDKEAFVTSSYRKKMEEMAKIDAEEEKLKQIEDILDVRKQNDLSGFYRHLYRQTMGEEVLKFEEKSADLADQAVEEGEESGPDQQIKKTKVSDKRVYRPRQNSEEPHASSDSSDPDKDTDIESDSDSKSSDEPVNNCKSLGIESNSLKILNKEKSKGKKKLQENESDMVVQSSSNADDLQLTTTSSKEAKPKINIFAHRNSVEEIEAARQRYLQRIKNKGIS